MGTEMVSDAEICDRRPFRASSSEAGKRSARESSRSGRSLAGGATALLLAAQEGHLDVLEQLLKSNADVNAQAISGASALILVRSRVIWMWCRHCWPRAPR
jgi:Ankyrin repeat